MGGSFRRPPFADFGVDVARSFADDTTGEGGPGVRSRRCRWRSESRGVYNETGTSWASQKTDKVSEGSSATALAN